MKGSGNEISEVKGCGNECNKMKGVVMKAMK